MCPRQTVLQVKTFTELRGVVTGDKYTKQTGEVVNVFDFPNGLDRHDTTQIAVITVPRLIHYFKLA